MFDAVAAPGRRDHLLVVDVDQARDLSDGGSVAADLIGVDDLRDIVFSQQPGQEGPCSVSITMPLKQNVEHEAVLVDCSPEPVSDAIDIRPHLVQMLPGTPSVFPVAQAFGEERAELDTPFAEGLVAELNAAPAQQLLNISIDGGTARRRAG